MSEPGGMRTRELAEAIALMKRLRAPDGCPWDREQTFESIMPHTLEETYEVFDAIERQSWPELCDELGDLLLQVLFYAQMAEEAGYFAIEDVAAALTAKLTRRHPHLFGDAVATTAAEVNRNWEAVKHAERRTDAAAGYLDSVLANQPALLEAGKLGARAAKAGFDWPDAVGLLDKVQEELDELQEAVARGPQAETEREEEFGDLLFTMTNLARHLRLSPELSLRKANRKFRRRFRAMETACAGGADGLRGLGPEELEALWAAAKAGERQRDAEPAELPGGRAQGS